MASTTPSISSPSKGFFKQNIQANSAASNLTERTSPASRDTAATKSSSKGFFQTGAREETGNSALLGLLLYSFMILFFPLFVYFAAKQVMEDSFDFVPPTSVLAPAIMAVAAVNIIIVAYVVKAFREEQLQEKNKTE